jgi:hypothetical protein
MASDLALTRTADGTRLAAVVRGGTLNGYVATGNADGTSVAGWTLWTPLP